MILLRYGYSNSDNQHLIWRQDQSGSQNMQYACHVFLINGYIHVQSAGGAGNAIIIYTGA